MAEIKEQTKATLETAELYTTIGQRLPLQKKNVMIEIYENVFSPFLDCEVTFKDEEGIFEEQNISGGEMLDLEILFPFLENEEMNIKEKFFIYSVTGIPYSGTSEYILKGISIEYAKGVSNLISKNYSGTISSMVKKLLEEEVLEGLEIPINLTKKISKSKNQKSDIIIPNMNVFKAINFLVARASSADNDVFLFHRNTLGYNLVGINELAKIGIGDLYRFKQGFSNAAGKNQEDREKKTPIGEDSVSIMSDVSVKFANDYLQGIHSKLYSGEMIIHDLLAQSTKKHEFSLKEDFDTIPKFGETNPHSLYDKYDKTFIEGTGTTRLVSNSNFGYEKNIFVRNYVLSSLQQSISATFMLNDPTGAVRSGLPVELEFATMDFGKPDDKSGSADPNERLSGKYLTTKVSHTFSGGSDNLDYTVSVSCAKNAID